MPSTKMCALSLFSVLLSVSAIGQSLSKAVSDADFRKWDKNESGWLSGNELTACKCAHFDNDGDGEVTREEFRAGRGGKKAEGVKEARADNPAVAPQPGGTNVGSLLGAWWYSSILFANGSEDVIKSRQSGLTLAPNGRFVINTWLGGANNMRTAGTYSFTKDKLVLLEDGGNSKSYNYKLSNDGAILTLRDSKGAGYKAQRSQR